MRWQTWEERRLNTFLLSRKKKLVINLYKNIIAGELKFRREDRLFFDMSTFVGRTPEQCKSKMQKYEKFAYTEFLGVPKTHFEMFLWLRKKKSKKKYKKNKNKNSKKLLEQEQLKAEEEKFNKFREEIILQIETGVIKFNGKYLREI